MDWRNRVKTALTMIIDEPIHTVANALLVEMLELVDQVFAIVLRTGWEEGRLRWLPI